MADEKTDPTHVYPVREGSSEGGNSFTEGKDGVKAHVISDEKLQDLVDQVGDSQNGVAPVDDLHMVRTKIEVLTIDQAKAIIAQLLEDHKWDYNFPQVTKDKLARLAEGPLDNQDVETWEFELKAEAAVNKFFSPYPEVRAVTDPTDDPSILCETIRAHLLGYIWACLGQFINSLFNSRYPQSTFSSTIAQIFLYPCGKACHWILPDWGFTLFGTRHSLNPGPWTYKEQMLATIIVDVSITSAYVFWNIQTQTVYYRDTWLTAGYEIMLLLSTQLMGLGFAGVLRRFVIYPTFTFWPSTLSTLALNRALLIDDNQKETIHGWSWSRYKFFWIFFGAMCVYFWFPDYIFTALSYFAWISWISPNNFKLAAVTGSQLGMGFNPLPTLDWNYMSVYWAPLYQPTFAYVQQYCGLLISSLAVLGIYFSNTKWTAYLPPNSSGIFDNTGASYNSSRVIVNGKLDETLYKEYSPAFYSAGNLVLYGMFFAYYPLTFTFIVLDMWRDISKGFKGLFGGLVNGTRKTVVGTAKGCGALCRGRLSESGEHFRTIFASDGSIYDGFDDPFTNLMRAYPEVPDWWFLAIIAISFVLSIIVITQYPLGVPVWTIFFVLGLNAVFLVPMTYLYAIAGTTEGLNVVTELVVGYALPGNPQALMFVKAFGYNINGQADNYISDQKMGLYAKVPPRAMYRGQLISSIIACFVCYGVVNFVDGFNGICTPEQTAHFNCENGSQVYYSSSVVWGLIGPKRIFDQIYPIMKYCFLLGWLLALAWWSAKRYGSSARNALSRTLPSGLYSPLNTVLFTPISYLAYVHPSMVFNGALYLAPLNLSYATCGLYVNLIFMYWIKRTKTAWFEKYNYILNAALSGAVAFMGIIIFFAVQYKGTELLWWGNDVVTRGVDSYSAQVALIPDLPAKGYFGPDTWY